MTRVDMGKILVIRGGAIGDFILTLPVLRALRDFLPGNQIDVIGYSHIAGLAVAGGLAEGVRSIESRALARYFAPKGSLDEDTRLYFSECDLILSFLYDPGNVFAMNVQRSTQGQYIAGPHRPDESLEIHATETFLKPLERLAIFSADPVPRLSLDLERLQKMQITSEPPRLSAEWDWLAVHPGSGSESKNWPEKQWLQLLHKIIDETSWNILLVGGEAEGDRLERFSAALPEERHLTARKIPLIRLAQLLLQAKGFIGHDSGISHLAAALGMEGIALWAETSARVWQPLSDKFQILKSSDGIQNLSPERVYHAILERWQTPTTSR